MGCRNRFRWRNKKMIKIKGRRDFYGIFFFFSSRLVDGSVDICYSGNPWRPATAILDVLIIDDWRPGGSCVSLVSPPPELFWRCHGNDFLLLAPPSTTQKLRRSRRWQFSLRRWIWMDQFIIEISDRSIRAGLNADDEAIQLGLTCGMRMIIRLFVAQNLLSETLVQVSVESHLAVACPPRVAHRTGEQLGAVIVPFPLLCRRRTGRFTQQLADGQLFPDTERRHRRCQLWHADAQQSQSQIFRFRTEERKGGIGDDRAICRTLRQLGDARFNFKCVRFEFQRHRTAGEAEPDQIRRQIDAQLTDDGRQFIGVACGPERRLATDRFPLRTSIRLNSNQIFHFLTKNSF